MAENGWLVIEQGPNQGGTFHIRQDVLTIGRAPTNMVQVVHASVSRRHAQLRKTPEGIVVTDLKSSNGTFVNGQRISGPTVLNHNDLLQVGDVVLRFKIKTILGNKVDLIMERKEASPKTRVMETRIQEVDDTYLKVVQAYEKDSEKDE
ncbi:FHA domain-containing protein [bacterium]|nr:FHA domain-containing protein [candidate division CSSED10-310 bacterium]